VRIGKIGLRFEQQVGFPPKAEGRKLEERAIGG
jgi:hypothetical protein